MVNLSLFSRREPAMTTISSSPSLPTTEIWWLASIRRINPTPLYIETGNWRQDRSEIAHYAIQSESGEARVADSSSGVDGNPPLAFKWLRI